LGRVDFELPFRWSAPLTGINVDGVVEPIAVDMAGGEGVCQRTREVAGWNSMRLSFSIALLNSSRVGLIGRVKVFFFSSYPYSCGQPKTESFVRANPLTFRLQNLDFRTHLASEIQKKPPFEVM